MKHITFTIHEKYVEYRMDNHHGSHPLFDESPQKVIDYIAELCNADSVEITKQ